MTLSFSLERSAIEKAVRKLKFRTQAFIDGRFCGAASGTTYTSINPATGKPLAEIAACEAPDIDQAVKAARRAFERGAWAKCPAAQRKRVMLKLADLIEENLADLAPLDFLDAGKPISDCMNTDLPDTVHCFRWHAEAVDKEYERLSPVGCDNAAIHSIRPLESVR